MLIYVVKFYRRFGREEKGAVEQALEQLARVVTEMEFKEPRLYGHFNAVRRSLSDG